MVRFIQSVRTVVQEHKRRATQHAHDHSLRYEQIAHHHAQILAQQEDNSRINQISEETHVCEVAEEHIVQVALAESVHRKCEVIHECEMVVPRPNQVQTIDQRIQACNCEAHITIRQLVKQLVQIAVEILVEVAGRHLC